LRRVINLLDAESVTLLVVVVADAVSVNDDSELVVGTVQGNVDAGLTVDVVGLTTARPGFGYPIFMKALPHPG